jgi:hypothetical protein
MGECRSCRRPVLWTLTPAGAKAPIDVEPVADGNTLVLQPSALTPDYLSVVLSGSALEQARQRGRLRINHWASCPDKAEWREKQAAKKRAREAAGAGSKSE